MLNEYDQLIDLVPDDASQGSDLYYIKEILLSAGPLTLLDLGCGIGITYEKFRAINNQLEWIGVDIEDSMEAKQRIAGLPLKVWNGTTIPLGNASVDIVYAHQILEYVRSPDHVKKLHVF
jgi:ubiquinone/menaquinone biosynthesis C-methylase UbiE